jgi:hypothetical protein
MPITNDLDSDAMISRLADPLSPLLVPLFARLPRMPLPGCRAGARVPSIARWRLYSVLLRTAH